MPGPHMLTPPPNHATSVRHYCPLYSTIGSIEQPRLPASDPHGLVLLEHAARTSSIGKSLGLYFQ